MKKTRQDVAYMREFGQRMRAARKNRALTQEELAEHAETDSTTISKIELGKGNPTLVTIIRISRALDRDCADFFPSGPWRTQRARK